jgi:lipid-binding SYLF domain-containing protein
MKNTFKKLITAAFATALMLTSNVAATTAQDLTENKQQKMEARREAQEAARVLSAMMKKPDDFIPRELLERAHAIAIIPDVVKAAFIVGGRGGDGVVARRTANGWSVPVYYDMGGASFGVQIGAKKPITLCCL